MQLEAKKLLEDIRQASANILRLSRLDPDLAARIENYSRTSASAIF